MIDKPGFAGRTVVITGTSTGIGRACALHLDGLGFHVFAGVRTSRDAESLHRESARRITPLLMDVTDNLSVRAAADAVTGAAGDAGLFGLVNNAGIVVSGPLEFLPESEIRKQFEVNVMGSIAVVQAFLPLIRKARGRIVNMSSISGRMALPFLGPYAASKFALEAITDSLRVELLPWEVKVSLVEPGAVKTPIWEKSRIAAETTARNFPPEAYELYGRATAAFRSETEKADKAGVETEVVVRAVENALTAKEPKTRYLVGRHVHLQAFLRSALPDRLFDWFISRRLEGS
ncbi:MAG TPA: SDR family oxidoreductase [Nitrospirota bacterium]|nr:SDR family oxidoreductase [Nitrospirota bacterium]